MRQKAGNVLIRRHSNKIVWTWKVTELCGKKESYVVGEHPDKPENTGIDPKPWGCFLIYFIDLDTDWVLCKIYISLTSVCVCGASYNTLSHLRGLEFTDKPRRDKKIANEAQQKSITVSSDFSSFANIMLSRREFLTWRKIERETCLFIT